MHEKARIGVRQKVEGGERHLRKFWGRSQRALGEAERTRERWGLGASPGKIFHRLKNNPIHQGDLLARVQGGDGVGFPWRKARLGQAAACHMSHVIFTVCHTVTGESIRQPDGSAEFW